MSRIGQSRRTGFVFVADPQFHTSRTGVRMVDSITYLVEAWVAHLIHVAEKYNKNVYELYHKIRLKKVYNTNPKGKVKQLK